MERADLSAHRILMLGAKTHSLALLRSVLNIAGIDKVIQVDESRRAIEMLQMEHFSAVFCALGASGVSGMSFPVAVRRLDGMLSPMIPIFMLQERARRRDVLAARDEGVTDVLTLPISPRTLTSKLRSATQAPRPFIVSLEFFGPDRRARADRPFLGADRRTRAAKKAKIDFTQL